MKQLYSFKSTNSNFFLKLFTLVAMISLTSIKSYGQVCIPEFTLGCTSSDKITYFGLNTISNGSDCSTSPVGYGDYTGLGPANLTRSLSYPAIITTVYGQCGVAIWIDFNDNSIFDSGEKVGYSQNNLSANETATITTNIPPNANLGTHALRVRLVYQETGLNIDPCSGYTYGEAEDYLVTIDPLAACSGSPVAGAAVANGVCSSITNFTLSLANNTPATGIDYQWQSSPDAINWINYGSPISDDYHYTVPSIATSTYFRCVATCTALTFSGVSSPVLVHPTTSMNCICKPNWPNYMVDCTQDKIVNFSLGNLINQTTNCDAYGYSDSTASLNAQINLNQGVGYMLSVNTLVSGSNGDAFTGAWIDFNQNSTFDPSEYTPLGNGQSGNFSNSITIPLDAVLGITRMRLAMDAFNANSGTVLDPCANNAGGLGQILDYRVNISPPPMCSAAPNAGNAIATETIVCPNVPYSLDLVGSDVATGLTYQWYSSPDNTFWSSIASASASSSLSVNTQTATTYYQCVVTCTASAQTSTSTPFVVAQNPIANCLCVPDPLYCAGGDYFTAVDFLDVVDNPTCNGGDNGYADHTLSSPTSTVAAGQKFSIDLAFGNVGNGPSYVSAWIDENQNGIFDNSEKRVLANGVYSSLHDSIAIPYTALGGLTRMRIKLESYWAPLTQDACTTKGYYGQTVDYYLGIIPASPCNGSSVAGNAVSNYTNVCTDVPYTLNLINNTQASGILYQWQSSLNGTTWTDLASQQTTVPFAVNGQSVTTHYRCVTTCTNSASTATSNPVIVLQNLPTACYCVPPAANCSTSYVSNIILETLNHTPVCNDGVSGYVDYTGSIGGTPLSAGQTYTVTASVQGFGYNYLGAWIDYDQNGFFEESEYSFLDTSYYAGTIVGSINVPFTALGGTTRMRLKLATPSFSPPFTGLNPCSSEHTNAQTIDYPITITAAPSCSGTPTAGNATSDMTNVCLNVPYTLDLVNNDQVSNILYQWQSSTDNATWTNLGSAQTTIPFPVSDQTATTYYRCIVTCTTSALSATSTPITVIQNPLTACYCLPDVSNCTNDYISNVTFETINNNSNCTGASGYDDYTGTVASATVNAGQTYSVSITINNDAYENVSAWIDYNQNGIFDTNEYKVLGTTSFGNFTILSGFDIPANALTGTTRMRIRNFYNNTASSSQSCTNPVGGGDKFVNGPPVASGETEDYLITILPPNCGGLAFPNGADPIATSTSICMGSTVALDLNTPMPIAQGITYQWKSSIDGSTYTSIGSPLATSSIAVNPNQNLYYMCDVLCNSSLALASSSVFITVADVSTSMVTSNVNCFGDASGSISLTPNGGTAPYTYSWSPAGGNNVTATNLAAGVYQCIIQDVNGCADTISATITQPTVLMASITNINNVTCNGLTDGAADVTASGGASGYTYLWTPGLSTVPNPTNLAAGNYTCTVVDAYNCSTTQTVTITEPSQLTSTSSQTNLICAGGNTGAIDVTANGGSLPYTYFWSGGFGAGTGITGASAQTYTCTITDANNCTLDKVFTLTEPAQIGLNIIGNFSLCEHSSTTYTSIVTNAVGVVTYTWSSQPSGSLSNMASFSYTAPSATTETLYLSVTDANGCSKSTAGIQINISPSTNISGSVLTATTSAIVAGNVILYKYEPFFTKFDSIDYKVIDASGNYNFTSVNSGLYIVKAVPTSTLLQITYGNSEENWKTAAQISHGCGGNEIQNISVIPLENIGSGSGSLSGKITQGLGFGHKISTTNGNMSPLAPGQPIGGIIVKGGKNPGGTMFVQTTTAVDGTYTLQGLPENTGNEYYFILVDIPGLDTNSTYRKVINLTNNNYTNLDFVVDSVKINPINNTDVGVYNLNAIEHQIKVFPNPANNIVNIKYGLKDESLVNIELFDLLGKSIKSILPSSMQNAKEYRISTDIHDLPSGVYFIKIKINNAESNIKLIITN